MKTPLAGLVLLLGLFAGSLAAQMPPTVVLTSPADGASFSAPAAITLTATATDSDGTVAKVEFFNGATKLGEATTPSAPNTFTLPVTLTQLGSYTLTARVIDDSGASSDSAASAISVMDLSASPYGFSNFDFEDGLAGWTGGSGIIVGGIQGDKAYSSEGYYGHTMTSLPFTMPAGVTVFSVQIAGNHPPYGSSYIAMVDATTGAVICQLTRTRPNGWDWEPCSATISLSTPKVVYLRIVQAGLSSHYFFYDDIRLDTLPATFSNFDFEQGWTGWTAVGYGAQIDSFVSDGKLPAQGTKAYQSAGGSGTLSSTEKARINHLYSGTFLIPAGQKLLTGQLFGGDANSSVALVNATTGVVLAQLGRFDSGPSWEKCYATFNLATDTRAYLRVIDASSTTHIAVDDLRITDYVFSNFDFEQGWAGWTGGSGIVVGGIQGSKAYSSEGYYSHTLTSLPFTMPAGVSAFSVQIAGNQPIYSWQHSYIAVVDATTGAVISQLTRTRPSGWDWEPCSTTISLSTPTVVHLKIVQADASSHYFFYDDIRLDTLPATFSNFDFEQGWTGWTAVGYGAQIDSFVSDGKLPVQGTKAYQSAGGSGTLSSTEKARINHLYSGTFLIPAGQKLLTGQLFGGDANSSVALVNATTGVVLAQLGRFDSGPSWEKCYATFNLAADTRAYLRVIDASSTAHIAVDDLRITDYVFSNFDFEQGWAGWTGGSGIVVGGIQGSRAYSSEGRWGHTMTSLPFTLPAGVTVFSVQIAGNQPLYGWQHSYIAVVDATTGAVISQLTRTRPSGWDWEPCSTTINLSTPTVVHLKIVQDGSNNFSYFFYDDIRLSTVTTSRAPSITQQPESRSVFSGDSVTITAAVDGYPPPNLQWMHNGIPIAGATMPILTLSSVQTSHAGGYTLVAVNQVGTATSATATLTIAQATQVISFDPLVDKTFGDVPFNMSATASSGLPVNFSIISGPATVAGSTVTITGTGTVMIRASQAGDANYSSASDVDQSFVVAKGSATVTLGSLNQIYDTTPKAATATTVPAGLTVDLTYDGSATAPASAGSYAVVGTINDANYAGSTSGVMTIAHATPIITWAAPAAITYPTALSGTQLNATANAAGTFNYTPSAGTVLNAGNGQALSVLFTPTDTTNYTTASAGNTIAVNPAPVTFTVTPTSFTYDGGAQGPTITSDLVGATWTVTAGQPSATNAGNYSVTATANGNYTGTSGPIAWDITKASATVTLGNLTQTFDGTPKSATATTVPAGLAVDFTYDGGTTPPTNAGSYAVVGTINDANFQGSASGVLQIDTPNLPPTAVPGPDRSIRAGDTVSLNGIASFDDNTPSASLAYAWSFAFRPIGSAATLGGATTATPSFVADLPGTYIVRLVVTDGGGLASPSVDMVISSDNLPPTAVATPLPALVILGEIVQLDGTGSTDPENDPLTYVWTISSAPAGSTAMLANSGTATPSINPDVAGTYVITLNVADPLGFGTPDTATFTATTASGFAEILVVQTGAVVASLPPTQVTTAGNQNALTNFLSQALAALNAGDTALAISKLQQAIERTDGCNRNGTPDGSGPGRDWITDCAAQAQVYPSLRSALDALSP